MKTLKSIFTHDIGVVSGGAAAAILAKMAYMPSFGKYDEKNNDAIVANMARMTNFKILSRMAMSMTTMIIRKNRNYGKSRIEGKELYGKMTS